MSVEASDGGKRGLISSVLWSDDLKIKSAPLNQLYSLNEAMQIMYSVFMLNFAL